MLRSNKILNINKMFHIFSTTFFTYKVRRCLKDYSDTTSEEVSTCLIKFNTLDSL